MENNLKFNILSYSTKKKVSISEVKLSYGSSFAIFEVFYEKELPKELNFFCYYLMYYENLYHTYYRNLELRKFDKLLDYKNDYILGDYEDTYVHYLNRIHDYIHKHFTNEVIYKIYKNSLKYKDVSNTINNAYNAMYKGDIKCLLKSEIK